MLNKLKLSALAMIPGALAPENQYAKSFAAVLCLAVSADKEFEHDEFMQASIFIEQDGFLRDNGLTARTMEYFKKYCEAINQLMAGNNIDFPAMQTELIAEARNVPTEYLHQLRQLVNQLRSGCNQVEQSVLNRINL